MCTGEGSPARILGFRPAVSLVGGLQYSARRGRLDGTKRRERKSKPIGTAQWPAAPAGGELNWEALRKSKHFSK